LGVGGFLRNSGALDFGGGIVVHVTAGVTALVTGRVMRMRRSDLSRQAPPQSSSMAVLGAVIMGLGWFGLTSGMALSSGGLAASAYVATYLAAASACFIWAILDGVLRRHPALLGVMSGAVAGLVAITPAAGFVTVWGAIIIGVMAAVFCYFFLAALKSRHGNDVPLNVLGLQGVAGVWGVIATGLWATKSVNPNGADGLFYGNPGQLMIQVRATLAAVVYTFIMSWILLKLVDWIAGLRAPEPS